MIKYLIFILVVGGTIVVSGPFDFLNGFITDFLSPNKKLIIYGVLLTVFILLMIFGT